MMQLLSEEQFESWRLDARVLEKDRYGEKVLLLSDGTMLKLFRRKSWFSKTLFFPPAERFAANAAALRKLDVPCPQVISTYKLLNPYRSVVHYQPLAGETLRSLLKTDPSLDQQHLFAQLASFITSLHDKGVYFRSLHLGNIVLTPDGQLGLIDISDLRCLGKSLNRNMRKRNYRHLLRYDSDFSLAIPAARDLLREHH
ncbi:toluene tolerance protein [Pseudomonas aestusnigri]|uniref:lipopolysaccharide kinase InaA family protein n=1 Tax=Halopseudomonas aestusnigri TaxID=857252 RepID=UPI001D191021|nr:lipopolysaccharide kinase InaA family protein [Halopseudomonas aestusnigri]MCC4260214.1 toluene tolerance protein [Halopseudomonas aestusnigri]